MASKYQVIVGLAEQTSAAVASSSETWREFLTTAANNYKYSFNDQLLIHAQRPGATACADIETWNKLGRWVNKGTKGIALLNDEHTPYKLRHVFDIADTNSYYGNTIKLWSLDRAQDGAVIESLENSFGEIENKLSLPNSLLETAKNTVDDNFLDYFSDLISIKADSLLAELDDDSIRVWFKNLLIASVGFMLFTRCGIDTRLFFEPEDFIHIYDFSTPETISVLGSAASDVSEMVLRDIGATVLSIQREAKKADRTFAVSYAAGYNEFESKRIEGSETNGADLQNSGGLSSAESDRTASPNAGQIWDAEAGIPEGAPQRHLHRSDAVGQAGQPPDGDRQAGGRNDGAFDGSAGEGSGTDREPEGSGSDEVGRADEQHPSLSGGDSESGADLPLTDNLPSVEQQQSSIEEAEAETASAFVISQEDIDAVLTRGGNVEDGKLRIYEQYQKELSHAENIAMLKSEYGTGGSYPAVAGRDLNEAHDGKGIKISSGIAHPRAEILLSWSKVEKRIGELIAADRYLTSKDKEYFEEYLQKKEERVERSAIGEEFISIVRDYNDFQRDLGNTAACLNQYVLSECAQQFSVGSKTTWALSGHDFILPLMREALTSIISEDAPQKGRASELFDRLSSDLAMALEPSYEEMNPEPEPEKEYRLLLGDVVYLGTQNYEVLSYNKDHVRLYDPSFPLFNKEYPRAEFDQMLRENPLNDSLLVSVDELDELDDEALEEVFAVEEAVPEPEAMDAPKSQPRPKTQSFDLHPSVPLEERNNYRINNDALGAGTPSERYTGNTAAIGLLKQLESEERYASPDEQEILSRYVGWGGLADCFDEKNSHYSQLKALLSEDEYASARESTLTAFYTPPVVIRSIYKALENMGFKSGNILEPSCGVGNFIGMLPESMSGSRLYGVELDSISGRIAQQLYQKSSIAVQGFEKSDLPDSFFDAAIGNVPFGQFKVSDKRYDKNNFLIHDYFFARTLDKVRPGGIIAFVTSTGTLDKENPAVRKYIAQRADLLGAIRLPNDTFKSAAGTEVTSDIIFLQKRDRLVDIEPDWVHLGKDENGVTMNQYYIDNPYMLMGKMKIVSGQFGPESACVPYEGQDLGALLGDAIQNIHAEVAEYELSELPGEDEDLSIPADPGIRNFSYTVSDGRLYYRENSRMNPVEVSVTAENRIKGMTAIRDCVRTLIELQTEDYPDADIQAQQETLNALYDDFAEKYGRINDRANSSAYANDSSYPLLASLEILDDERNFVRKADMFCKRTIKQRVVITSVDTASEALAVSLSEKAKIDMEYMAELTGKTEQELYDDLHGVIFLNPLHTSDYDGRAKYLTADEYLSGNVREKLIWAKRSAELYPEDYKVNVEALEAVQPVDLTASEISVRLGATWLPTEIIEDFTFNLLSTPRYSQWNIHVHFSQYTGEWNIEGKSYDRGNFKAFNTYGTDRINAYKIIEETLNLRDVRIFDYIEDGEGHKQAVLNRRETAIAQGKQELIKQAFADWIWNDPERRSTLCKLYNEKFNSNRPREYDGTFLSLVGINPEITLRKHQIDAVARGILGGNELLAHVVGAGKTYTMTAIAQESKRLGLCQKSLFVVPNHLTEQWASEYLQLYPSANILVASKKDFEMKNRRKFCGRIATGDYDAIIIGHSQFEKIPMSIERQRVILEQQLQEIVNGIMDLKRNRGDNFSVKQLERTKKTVKQKIEKLNDQSRKDDLVTFEELGVDRVFIDEAHFYKNLAAFSKMRNVGGISQTEAMKSSDLYMKCRYLDELTGGRGVVFATGTPISNSMVEMFTMQKYLQYDALRRNNLIHFDAWASTFGETVTAIELAPEGSGYRAKTRFARFYNLPELIMMFREVADIQTADMLNLPVPKANYHNILLKPSVQQKEMVASLAERAERVRNKMVDSSVDNMLVITNDGRKLALDQRLINDMLPDNDSGKCAACAQNVYEIWERTSEMRSAQMVFCDLSTPHGDGRFNVYDDIRGKLIAKGIPAEEIAYIHSANTEIQKKELFGKVRSGQIRVLIGSTQKMGAGTNVQQKLIALHHLDCPWRPSDLQQREGRIIRQGNENPEVDIFTYVTEDTFDSYLYQLVESKQKFIGQIMTSKSPVRSAEDIDEQALSYAEIKALCTGNPHIKEKMDLDIDVSRLKLLKANHLSQRYALEDQILKDFPQQIASYEQRIEGFKADITTLSEKTVPNEDGFSPMIIEGVTHAEKKAAGSAILEACKAMTNPDPVPLGQYRGFSMELSFDSFKREYLITMRGELRYPVYIGSDIFGNIQRLDNLFEDLPTRLETCEAKLANTRTQLESARIEVEKPFPQEDELKAKSARLDELNILLNMDKHENEIVDSERDDADSCTKSTEEIER